MTTGIQRDGNRSKTQWRQAAELFDQVATVDPTQRAAILGSLDIQPEVRDWLDRLLSAHDQQDAALIDGQMTTLIEALSPTGRHRPDAAAFTGERFGPWRAGAEIGRGGMGLVLEGERADGQFDKQVAIKVLDPGVVGEALRGQFAREIRILASLTHPSIAQLLDGGLNEAGVPFLVMERVRGLPIDRFCLENR
ncbi:MAG: protein kinase, partial [Pseudomonadota bacterium]